MLRKSNFSLSRQFRFSVRSVSILLPHTLAWFDMFLLESEERWGFTLRCACNFIMNDAMKTTVCWWLWPYANCSTFARNDTGRGNNGARQLDWFVPLALASTVLSTFSGIDCNCAKEFLAFFSFLSELMGITTVILTFMFGSKTLQPLLLNKIGG